MWNVFKNATIRQCSLKRTQRKLFLEPLEDRRVLATLWVDNTPGMAGTEFTAAGGSQPASVAGLVPGVSLFSTISAAVAAATAGDTVNVSDGIYDEAVNVNKTLLIQGNKFGLDARTRATTNETVVDDSLGRTLFYVTANDVTIDGFTVQDQTLVNQFGAGIVLGAGTAGSDVRNNIVQNNVAGIFVSNNSSVNQTVIERNLIQNNNQPGAASGSGIYADEFTASTTLTNVLIDNNSFLNNGSSVNGGGAINLSFTAAATPITDFAISNNLFDGNSRALVAFNLTNSSFTDNTLRNANWSASADLRLFEGINNLSITGNDMENGAGRALNLDNIGTGAANATNITFSLNSVLGYTGPADTVRVDAADYTGTFDASANYWGTSDPAIVAAKVSGPIDFTPLLDNDESLANQSVVGFQPDLSSLTVHTLGLQVGAAGRIQEGIDLAASGGTVNVLSGSYTGGADAALNDVTLAAGPSPGGLVTLSPNFTLTADDTLAVELNGSVAGTTYDQWDVAGTVALNGATLAATGTRTNNDGDILVLIKNDAADAVVGTFNGLPEGSFVAVNGVTYIITYKYNAEAGNFIGGNDVALVDIVPSAGNVIATQDNSGNLSITEDFATPGTNNNVTITFTADNMVIVTGNAGTLVNGGVAPVAFTVTGSISASLAGGNDDLDVDGNFFSLTGGGLSFSGGDGENDFSLSDLTLGVPVRKGLSVSNAGNAAPSDVNTTTITNLSAASIVVSNGANNSTSTSIIESDTTGNVTVFNNGGALTTHNVTIDPTVIGGSLTISNGGPSASYLVTVDDVTVGGNLQIVNGTSTGPAGSSVFVGQTAGTSAGASVGGNLTVQNGAAMAGDNFIQLSQTSVTGSANLSNGNAADEARIRLGDFGPAPVSVGGNLSAVNGNSGVNNIWLDRAVVGAEQATYLQNGNATAGDNFIRIGPTGGVANLGGLTAINGTAAAANRIHVRQGNFGAALGTTNNVLLQNGNVGTLSEISVGDVGPVNIPDGGLTVFDGTGNGTIDLIRTDLSNPSKGNLQINTSGGADTVNLAAIAGSSVRVRGLTNVTTGDGADKLNIATPDATLSPGGIAALDRIFASLGTGDDELNIGAGANGAPDANAFDALARFFFDAGEGGETVGDRARIATAALGPGITPAQAATRLFNFESVTFV